MTGFRFPFRGQGSKPRGTRLQPRRTLPDFDEKVGKGTGGLEGGEGDGGGEGN